MQLSEQIFFWLITGCYLAVFVSALFHAFFPKPRLATIANWSLWVGFIANIGLLIQQWTLYQHLPQHKAALILIAVFLFLQWKLKDRLTHMAIFVSLIAIVVLFLCSRWDPTIPLNTSENTRWLIIHMVAAWFAFGSFGMATAFAASYLVKEKRHHFLPTYTLETLDTLMQKLVAVGILFHMVMLVSGCIWTKKLFGRYWGWDPIEIWALLVFLFYMIYIHARLLLHLKGRLAAWMLIVGLILLGVSMWGLPFIFPNTHIQSPMESFKP